MQYGIKSLIALVTIVCAAIALEPCSFDQWFGIAMKLCVAVPFVLLGQGVYCFLVKYFGLDVPAGIALNWISAGVLTGCVFYLPSLGGPPQGFPLWRLYICAFMDMSSTAILGIVVGLMGSAVHARMLSS